jgi:hypothetical protein
MKSRPITSPSDVARNRAVMLDAGTAMATAGRIVFRNARPGSLQDGT